MRLVVETVDQTTRQLSHVAMTWPNQYALKHLRLFPFIIHFSTAMAELGLFLPVGFRNEPTHELTD